MLNSQQNQIQLRAQAVFLLFFYEQLKKTSMVRLDSSLEENTQFYKKKIKYSIRTQKKLPIVGLSNKKRKEEPISSKTKQRNSAKLHFRP